MDKERFERWKDFAKRMARTCFNGSRRPSPQWIIQEVDSWFEWRDYQQDWCEYNSWDQDSSPLCDAISEFYDDLYPYAECPEAEMKAVEQFQDQWMSPVLCCIRAGIDLACEPSAGVVGFTVCDLRAMYPEGIPDWINSGFTDNDGNETDLNAATCDVPIWL